MAASTFLFQVICPDRVEPEQVVVRLQVEAADGGLTVLAGHQPLICAVRAGNCIVHDAAGNTALFRCSEGVLEVGSDGGTSLLVSQWVLASDETATRTGMDTDQQEEI